MQATYAIQGLSPVVGARTVLSLLDRGADLRLLDVRTPGEFEASHIPGAYNVPLDTLAEHADDLRRHVNEPVVLICQSGGRAQKADDALRASGMVNLHVLEGGMGAWESAGLPVLRGAKRWGLERQVRLVAGSLVVLGAVGGAVFAAPLTWLAAMVGAGLTFSAATNTCGMAMLLAKLPYNRPASCDVGAMVEALKKEGSGSRARCEGGGWACS